MRNSIKKITAILSATILGALPMAGSLTADAAITKDTVKFVYGDLNNDGKITQADANKLQRLLSEDQTVVFTDEQLRRADVNGDGERNFQDVKMIIKFAADFTQNKKDIYGDADGNGKVNMSDAIMIEEFKSSGSHKGEINLMAADVNGDGRITTVDHVLVGRYKSSHYSVPATLYIRWGDLNSDGVVNDNDTQKLAAFLTEVSTANFTEAELRRADLNLDGNTDFTDVTWMILRVARGFFEWNA